MSLLLQKEYRFNDIPIEGSMAVIARTEAEAALKKELQIFTLPIDKMSDLTMRDRYLGHQKGSVDLPALAVLIRRSMDDIIGAVDEGSSGAMRY
ncbi:MAG: hypothetical protein MZV70_13600 [Desulfobacterales bacterium]|nr:hypothetical protein [Desulfobacterales bacterium]